MGKMSLSFVGAASAALLAAAPAQAAVNLVTDGGFEDGIDAGSFTTLNADTRSQARAITGWTVTSGSIDYIGTYWTNNGGSGNSIDLAGNSVGTISQTSNGLTAGLKYIVAFSVARNPDGGQNPRTGSVSFGGTTQGISYGSPTTSTTTQAMGWARQQATFVASGASQVLSFSADSSANGSFGLALDSVSVTATPEPEIYLSMLAGLGMAGFAARRRAKRAAAKAA